MRVEGIGPPLAVTDTDNATVFETYRERVLLSHLRQGRIMVMDNLTAHKSEKVRRLIEGVGCELVYLPSYSPDFNLIEESLCKCQAADRVSNVVPSRSIAHTTLTRRRASAMRA